MTSSTSTSASSNNNKYDRQLRLWGASGQRALGETLVVLIGASATGTETLKNLVLPGVGGAMIVDDAYATTADQASNFFVQVVAAADAADNDDDAMMQDAGDAAPSTPIPLPRAQVAMELLQEMNPDVAGRWKHFDSLASVEYAPLFADALSPKQLAAGTTSTTTTATQDCNTTMTKLLVVASDLIPPVVMKIAQACHGMQIPLLVVQSYGLIGAVRLQTPPLPLLFGTSAATNQRPPDLRLTRPFAALQVLSDSIQWSELDDHDHQHVPYPLILLQALKEWRSNCSRSTMRNDDDDMSNDNRLLPSSVDDKKQFVELIKTKLSRNYDKELNFQQAVQFSYLAYASADSSQAQLPLEHLQDLSGRCETACPKLYAIIQALLEFGRRHDNQPPLHGGIPDMAASTTNYVALQRVYKERAVLDLEEVRSILQQQASGSAAAVTVSDEELTAACQNVQTLELFVPQSIVDEYDAAMAIPANILEDLHMAATDAADEDERPDQNAMLWYLGLQACRLFHEQTGRYPGTIDLDANSDGADKDAYLQDVPQLQECLTTMIQRYQLADVALIQDTLIKRSADYATELARYGNAELHAIASVVGGVASQEAVKIITGQYVPIDNSYVYNGIASVAGVFKF